MVVQEWVQPGMPNTARLDNEGGRIAAARNNISLIQSEETFIESCFYKRLAPNGANGWLVFRKEPDSGSNVV
jgi:hypothetical protein